MRNFDSDIVIGFEANKIYEEYLNMIIDES